MSKALSFHEFATRKALDGNFDDIQDVKRHYNDWQYKSWLDTALNEYRSYLTDALPTMTLAEIGRAHV